MTNITINKITILGAGAFGYAMAYVLANNNSEIPITIYDIQEEIINKIQETKEHPFFHKGTILPNNVMATTNLPNAIENTNLIVLAIPSKFFRIAIKALSKKLNKDHKVIFLNLAKGLEQDSNKRISEILKEELLEYSYDYAALSGGMIASEVTQNAPLNADIACKNLELANLLKQLIENKNLKIRTSTDVIGTELCGALKNVAAIGAGIFDGLNLKESSKSGFISAIAKEMEELAIAEGSQTETFAPGSQAWWGDLMTTCFGASRNKEFGKRIGSGISCEDAIKQMYEEKKSVEGHTTIKVVYGMQIKHNLNAPLTKTLYQILFEGKEAKEICK